MENCVTRWWWIRHAPVTVANGKLYGQKDLPANTSNTDIFRALAGILPRKATWITTPLKRTTQTADAIANAGIFNPKYIVESGFIEQNFGDWQGLSWDELRSAAGEDFHKFWVAPADQKVPGGESFVNVMDRVSPAIDRLTNSYQGQDIISIAHGGSIRAAIAHALHLSPENSLAISIDNCGVSCIEHIYGPGKGNNWRIISINSRPGVDTPYR
tara:strand:- start:557 stop:1198 length:642 start_codon:yes stop_codon:yes gene_type:complete